MNARLSDAIPRRKLEAQGQGSYLHLPHPQDARHDELATGRTTPQVQLMTTWVPQDSTAVDKEKGAAVVEGRDWMAAHHHAPDGFARNSYQVSTLLVFRTFPCP